MRKWINLMEGLVEKPSFSLAVTDELVSEIIQSGKWVDHGGDLEDWWDQNDEYMYVDGQNLSDLIGLEQAQQLMSQPWSKVAHLPVCQEIVKKVLVASARYYDDNLVLTGATKIYRGIIIHEGEEFNSQTPVGRFWSTDYHQALRFISNDSAPNKSHALLMQTRIEKADVDWKETIRSRLDQFHGDEEEVQLRPGSPIELYLSRYDYQKGQPKLNGNVGWINAHV